MARFSRLIVACVISLSLCIFGYSFHSMLAAKYSAHPVQESPQNSIQAAVETKGEVKKEEPLSEESAKIAHRTEVENIAKRHGGTIDPQHHWIYIEMHNYLRGDRRQLPMPLGHVSDTENLPYVASALGNYKIHIMPKKDEIYGVLDKLLSAIKNDRGFWPLITTIKCLAEISPLNFATTDLGQPAPIIVIYVSSGKDNALKLLTKLYDLFKNTTFVGEGIAPRFNEKVTDLLYVAQGDADHKITPENAKYYDAKKIYFKVDTDGKEVDPARYHLTLTDIPETKEELFSTDDILNNKVVKKILERYRIKAIDSSSTLYSFAYSAADYPSLPLQSPDKIKNLSEIKEKPTESKAESRSEYFESAIPRYTFYLMPQNNEFVALLNNLFYRIERDERFNGLIACITCRKNITTTKEPIIAIESLPGKDKAQSLLVLIYKYITNHQEVNFVGRGISEFFPAQRITGLLYFSQGDADHKRIPDNAKYYDANKIYFKVNAEGEEVDPKIYHLMIPSARL